jgi:phosphoribosylformylglycinamidine cyclo-ligase
VENMYDTTKPYKGVIKDLIRSTWEGNRYVEVQEGYYNEFRRKHQGREVDHTDGLGTKGQLHWKHRTLKYAAQDALAMNTNDLVLVGARPYKAQVNLMLPEDDERSIVEVMTHLCELCKNRGIAITGGETSIHDNMEGMELSLTVSGVVTEKWVHPLVARHGDKLICLKSSGIHSNGLTMVRKLFGNNYHEWMVQPTMLYDHLILERGLPIHAAMHITGGGFTKVNDILPQFGSAHFERWDVPKCFDDIYDRYAIAWDGGQFKGWHKPENMMYRNFNMGVGLVLAVAPEDAEWVATATGGFIGGEVHGHPDQMTSAFVTQVVMDTKYGKVLYK